MRTLKAIKNTPQNMLEVTFNELMKLKNLNPHISIGDYDNKNLYNSIFKESEIVGYLAGEIDKLKFSLSDKDNGVKDVWFINLEFFNKNYKEV